MAMYTIQYDNQEPFQRSADSLAALVITIKEDKSSTWKRAQVWSPVGIPLIDTKFGDSYGIVGPSPIVAYAAECMRSMHEAAMADDEATS